MPEDDFQSLFQSWLANHGGAVLRAARAYTFTSEDRQDLTQEILLELWRSLPRFQGRASASTWIYRVALNTAIRWRRKERRRQAGRRPVFELQDLSPAGRNGAGRLAEQEAVERLYAAIRQLPAADAALVLMHLDDLSHRQIAEVLGISENNVAVKLCRARKALGELLKEPPHGSG